MVVSRIKFRAWDENNKSMYFSDKENIVEGEPVVWIITKEGVHVEVLDICEYIDGGERIQDIKYIIPNQTVMQFTGKKDKNGIEIYEGDIVRGIGLTHNPPITVTGIVTYLDNYAIFCVKINEDSMGYLAFIKDIVNIEVIGNKYEGMK